MSKRRKIHPEYYAIEAYQILAKKDDNYLAKVLNISTRTFSDKKKGYSDFKQGEADILAKELNRTKDEIFLT